MTIYDEIEIEDMDYEEDEAAFYYDCPCGDRFRVTMEELVEGQDIAECPSCTLTIKVIYEREDLGDLDPRYAEGVMAC